jgi:hypothetical protein
VSPFRRHFPFSETRLCRISYLAFRRYHCRFRSYPFHDRPAFVPLFNIPTTNIFFLRPTLSLAAVDRINRVCAAFNCPPCHNWRFVDEVRVMLHCRLQPGLTASCKKGSIQASAPTPSHPRAAIYHTFLPWMNGMTRSFVSRSPCRSASSNPVFSRALVPQCPWKFLELLQKHAHLA